MPPFDLFNLIPFYQRLPEQAASGQVGPFQIALSPSYDAAVRLVQHPGEAGGETPFPCFRIIAGCWAATAQASLVGSSGEQSVVCTSPVADGGTSDLLELLTFLTGRRVAGRETVGRYHPSSTGDAPVHFLSLFRAAAEAWSNRANLVEHKMQLAIIFHNCATDYDVIPVRAGMYNTALNILLDNWPDIGAAAIPRPVRNSLAHLVGQAVEAMPWSRYRAAQGLQGSPSRQGDAGHGLHARSAAEPGSGVGRRRRSL
jgi:hypothetical protein